jgi:hypothetical protein
MTETEKLLSKITTIQERLKASKKLAEEEASKHAMCLADLFEDKDAATIERKRKIYIDYIKSKTEANTIGATLTQIDVSLTYG